MSGARQRGGRDRNMVAVDIQTLEDFLDPLLSSMGYELVDLRWVQNQGRRILRLFVDCEGGMTLDKCATLSREVGTQMDVEECIPGSYNLEVSSPGLDRRLKKQSDFEKFSGRNITLQTRRPISGRSRYKGLLSGVEGDEVLMNVDKKEYRIQINNIAKANLVYES
jgi:ribosome maturation factor RimP